MTEDLRARLKSFLTDRDEWKTPRGRRNLVDKVLLEQPNPPLVNLQGNPGTAADRLIDACLQADCVGVLAAGLRKKYEGEPGFREEVRLLEARLCGGKKRSRTSWIGSPFVGLTYLDKDQAPLFFGRDMEVQKLAQELMKPGHRFTIVLGASGSGKSSLVRAGLWHGLAEGEFKDIPDSRQWLISTMIPGDDMDHRNPMTSLRMSVLHALKEHPMLRSKCDWNEELRRLKEKPLSALADRLHPTTPRWLVILDQMEELFTPDMKKAGAAFLDQLIQATEQCSRLSVVATLRWDFFRHCEDHPKLYPLIREGNLFPLGKPDREALQEMVSGPLGLNLLGEDGTPPRRPWVVDPALATTVAVDAEGHAGGLALMAFALSELYEASKAKQDANVATYKRLGKLAGSIQRQAEKTLKLLSKDGVDVEKALASVFCRLVTVVGEEPPTRQRARLSSWKEDADAKQVVERFQKARLLVSDGADKDDPVIEVAHEALLREWPKLRDWIEKCREAFQLAERVKTEAKAWSDPKRRPWPSDWIDAYRKTLEEAGLLQQLLEEEKPARLLTPEVEWIQEELQWDETTPLRRWEIGRRLDTIGDPRPGVGVKDGLPDILWVPFPAGEVELEDVRGSFPVEAFEMAAYPVTFAQFGVFVDAEDGYGNEDWWEGLKHEKVDSAWKAGLGNHPVTHVSWYDATAFCRWLEGQLKREVRLPDEQEWQWAAQGLEKKYAYPWGKWEEGRANTSESDINHATAVGMFPRGDSVRKALRVSDLAGNVWEWCRNLHQDPKKTAAGGDEYRVLRGGAWYSIQGGARAGYRYCSRPDNRFNSIGFRVVVSSPIGNAEHGNADH